jgi:hypothetical protein
MIREIIIVYNNIMVNYHHPRSEHQNIFLTKLDNFVAVVKILFMVLSANEIISIPQKINKNKFLPDTTQAQ